MSRKEALSQFIQQIHGRPVVVKLNSGVDYRGNYSTIYTFCANNSALDNPAVRKTRKPLRGKVNFLCNPERASPFGRRVLLILLGQCTNMNAPHPSFF